jgi:hypothetical protein
MISTTKEWRQDTINLSTYNKTTYMEMAGKIEGTDTNVP